MTIEACYQQLGGDFAQVKTRLPSVSLIAKFITKFCDDRSFSELCLAMQEGNRQEAFRAAHTLKGVSWNLSFDKLYDSATRLTELLRPEGDAIPEEALPLFQEVRQDYDRTVSAIRAYLESDHP